MNIFQELQRRNVYRVAIAYLVTAWLLAQVSDLALAAFGAPPWVQKTFLFLLALGFPVACLLAWAYELTPEGVRRSADAAESSTSVAGGHKALDLLIIGLLTVAVVVLAADRFLPTDTDHQAEPSIAAQRPSVAVLPFINRSSIEADAFFVDGVHEDLLRQIASIGSIKTISRTSVLQYRDSQKSAPEIAAELEVDTILEGGVQRAGKEIRINVQLIDAGSDEYLWTESYRRQLSAENIFSIQSEIASSVAAALQAALTPQERDELAKVPTTNIDALNLYFSGRRRMETRRPEELEVAVSEFERAVALDPDFALAYVALADTYRLLNNYGDLPQEIADAKGREAVDKALELDNRLGEAYASLANLRRRSGDYEGAEQAFLQGIELNPNYAPLYQWYSEFLAMNAGRPQEALAVSQKSVALDPKSAIINRDYAWTLHTAGQFERALAHFRISTELDPDAEFALEGEGITLRLGLSRMSEAIVAFRRQSRANPDDPWPLFGIASTLLDLGDPAGSAEIVARIARLAPGSEPHNWAVMLLELKRRNPHEAEMAAERLLETWPTNTLALRVLRDAEYDRNEQESARARYVEAYPNLQYADTPDIHSNDITAAVDYACLLDRLGDSDRAGAIVRASLDAMDAIPRLGLLGYKVADVRAHALRGDRRAALDALRNAYDEGWRVDWWLELEEDRCIEELRSEPEFVAVVELIREDMGRQRAALNDELL